MELGKVRTPSPRVTVHCEGQVQNRNCDGRESKRDIDASGAPIRGYEVATRCGTKLNNSSNSLPTIILDTFIMLPFPLEIFLLIKVCIVDDDLRTHV